jgi:hypothetical protein
VAVYRFTEPWPPRVIRRDVKVFVEGGDPRGLPTKTISPPETILDIGDFPEGTGLTLVITPVEQGGRVNKQSITRKYRIPDTTDVQDTAAGELVLGDEVIPEDVADSPAGTDANATATTGDNPPIENAGSPPATTDASPPTGTDQTSAPPPDATPAPTDGTQPAPEAMP